MSDCDHDWVRAPDRDMGYGMFPTRAWTLCFFCRKCLAIETRDVLYSEPRTSGAPRTTGADQSERS